MTICFPATARGEASSITAALERAPEFYTAPGVGHSFFNDATTAKNSVAGWHDMVLYRLDLFLESLGYVTGKPTVEADLRLSAHPRSTA